MPALGQDHYILRTILCANESQLFVSLGPYVTITAQELLDLQKGGDVMVALRCSCDEGAEVWGELWWRGGEHRWVFFDDDKKSETYAEQIERCPACGRRLRRKEMTHISLN